MRPTAFIYNPGAGDAKSQHKLTKLENKITSIDEAQLFCSKEKGDIPQLVESFKNEFEVFVACGGDGTVREVASALLGSTKILGILPIGTGNDLCKTLGIPSDLESALKIIFEEDPKPIDVGKCNDFIFLNALGFGFDGLTNRFAQENQKGSMFRYTLSALKASFKQRPFKARITTNDNSREKELLMVTLANGKVEGGGFWIAPEASICDGKLELLTIRPIARWVIPILLPLFLVKKADWIPHVKIEKLESIRLQIQGDVCIHADGEIIENTADEYDISLHTSCLRTLFKS